ncbi:MAG: hypothetical protein AB7R69_00495 [Candidatus Babeliales bacterium]
MNKKIFVLGLLLGVSLLHARLYITEDESEFYQRLTCPSCTRAQSVPYEASVKNNNGSRTLIARITEDGRCYNACSSEECCCCIDYRHPRGMYGFMGYPYGYWPAFGQGFGFGGYRRPGSDFGFNWGW